MKLRNDCDIRVNTLELKYMSLLLGIAEEALIIDMLSKVACFLPSLKERKPGQQTFTKKHTIHGESMKIDIVYVFYRTWWKEDSTFKDYIRHVTIGPVVKLNKHKSFGKNSVDQSVSFLLENKLLGE